MNFRFSLSNISSSLCLVLIFLVLFIPTSYTLIKAFLLVGLLLSMFFNIRSGGFRWSKATFFSIFLYSLVGLFYSFYGQINGNSGAFRVISTQFLWPLLYLFISALCLRTEFLYYFVKVLVYSLVFINIYTFSYLGNSIGLVPDFLYFELDQGQSFGLYEGYAEYQLYTITSLIFLVPILFHLSYNDLCHKEINLNRLALCVSSIVLVFLTGRKAFWLVILFFPIIMICSTFLLNSRRNPYNFFLLYLRSPPVIFLSVIIVFVTVYLLFYRFGLNLSVLAEYFLDGFNVDAGSAPSLRMLQYDSLINGWFSTNLLFGAGNGAHADVIRDVNMPWAYELTYVYMLFSTGIFGVVFYFFWFLYGIFRLRRAIGGDEFLSIYIPPIITGVFCLVIVSASNPYYAKFDYLWVVLLPHLLVDGAKYIRVNRLAKRDN
jgi:hypothetical protein